MLYRFQYTGLVLVFYRVSFNISILYAITTNLYFIKFQFFSCPLVAHRSKISIHFKFVSSALAKLSHWWLQGLFCFVFIAFIAFSIDMISVGNNGAQRFQFLLQP
jgi:hypothetical protein